MSERANGSTREPSTLTIAGTTLAYWRYGDPHADPLVMLHGLGSDHTGLLDIAAHLHGRQIILPDLPGFGHSPPLTGRHTLPRYADIIDHLRHHLGLTRFALLGHSLGADVALVYASTHPAAVNALCLLSPVLSADGCNARLGEYYYDLCARLPAALRRPLLTSPTAVYLSDRALFTTPDPAIRARILHQDRTTARLADPDAIRDSYLSIRTAPFDRYIQHIQAPTLLITGTRDPLATPASLTRPRWPAPHPQVEIVPGAGHLLPVERPELVAGLVQRFLLRTATARGIPTRAAA